MRLNTLLFGPTERSTFLFRIIVVCLSAIAFLPAVPSVETEAMLIWAGYLCLAGLLAMRKRPLGVRLALLVALVDVGAVSILAALAPEGAPPLWPLYFFSLAAAAISGPPVVAATAVLSALGWTATAWTSPEVVGVTVAWPAALLVACALAVVQLSGRWAVERRHRQVWQEAAIAARTLWMGDDPERVASTIAEAMARLARAKHAWLIRQDTEAGTRLAGRSLRTPEIFPPGDGILAALGHGSAVSLVGDAWAQLLDGRVGEAIALRSEWKLLGVLVLVWDEMPQDVVGRRTSLRSLSTTAADALKAADERAATKEELRLERALREAAERLSSTLDPLEVAATVFDVAGRTLGVRAELAPGEATEPDSPQPAVAGSLAVPIEAGAQSLVASREARPLTDAEMEWLRRIAAMADGALAKCATHGLLREEEQRLRSALEALPAPAFLAGSDGSIILANRAYQAMSGPNAELVGRLRRSVGMEEEAVVGEPPRTFAVTTVPVGQTGYKVTLFREVTREREALRAKDELIAMAGHELRSPLTSISGYSQMMARQLNVVQRQIAQLDQLIGDFMEASSFDDGHLSLDLEALDVADVARAAAERLAGAHPARPLRLKLEGVLRIEGDPTRLGQVLDNLLSNANKYSPEESAEIELGASEDDDHVLIWVRDHGVGIEPEHLTLLFERFYRVRSSETQGVKGLGLGLSIVRDLVVAHGGSVWAESAGKGQGSTFWVRLPVSKNRPARLPLRRIG